jgi:hypothetical protein
MRFKYVRDYMAVGCLLTFLPLLAAELWLFPGLAAIWLAKAAFNVWRWDWVLCCAVLCCAVLCCAVLCLIIVCLMEVSHTSLLETGACLAAWPTQH